MAGETKSAGDAARHVGPLTATMLVVASMVGTGIFTTSGLLIRDLGSPIAVLVVDFSAPLADSALAFGHYVSAVIPAISPTVAGIALVVVAAVPHATHARLGGRVQVAVTVLEIVLVLAVLGRPRGKAAAPQT